MVPNSSTHPLLRVVSSLVLAITAMTLSVATAHADTRSTSCAVDRQPGPRPARSAADSSLARGQSISVLLADGQMFFRMGMRAAIAGQADMSCVAEVGDGLAAVRELQRLRPDVALVDLDLPGLGDAGPIDTTGTRILALATEHTDENLYRALHLGATGFLARSGQVNDLLSAIRTAVHGTALIDPTLTRQLITRLSAGIEPFPATPEVETLTPREHQVLHFIAKGCTNPEIALALGIGEQTVKTHVSHVLTKLGVRDRLHAAVYAHTRRIGPIEA
ncbi:response regulator transcription factor [Nocardia sp. XZ_19_385]|uniref:LuxR C-terminal-related transcriptional regulator n=1 Tax=Nocardia sp. XZ_19_385 TaxID=2769488 RepID=UPI001E2F158A|nr:response regulator transcription factor [Nocardia sp. XZ_19_385]